MIKLANNIQALITKLAVSSDLDAFSKYFRQMEPQHGTPASDLWIELTSELDSLSESSEDPAYQYPKPSMYNSPKIQQKYIDLHKKFMGKAKAQGIDMYSKNEPAMQFIKLLRTPAK
jgi:hypothetical protein